jgi:hypothetical protein
LVTAHAHISTLEAKLKTSREAWESANAAKVSAEKAAKSAENKAKKAEKALAESQHRQTEWEQSIAERLDKISILVGSKYRIAPLEYLLMLSFADVCLLIICLCLCGTTGKIGESWKLRQPNTKDPLLAVVDLLESNWKLVQNVLQLTRNVLIRMFAGFWLKKKKEMPSDNLQKLLEAFETVDDPVLALKRTSMKRGVEGVLVPS